MTTRKVSIQAIQKRAEVIAAATKKPREEILERLIANHEALGIEVDSGLPSTNGSGLDFTHNKPDFSKTQPLPRMSFPLQ